MGWYTDEQCTVSATFPLVLNKAVNLYPLVVPMTSCVQTYDLNYAGAPDSVSEFYEVDSVINLPAFDPTRPGYTFGGWYLEPTCVNKVNGDDMQSLVISVDRTFYAKWIPVKQLTVSFSYNYEGAPADQVIIVDAGERAMPPAIPLVRDGYVFDGWFIDEACEYEADFSEAMEYDTTFYARWKPVGGNDAPGGIAGFFAAIFAWFAAIFKKIFGM